MTDPPRIAHACLTSLSAGLVELNRDWPGDETPPLTVAPDNSLTRITKVAPQQYGLESGYYFSDGTITFVLDPAHYPWLRDREARVMLAGDFNDWSPWDDRGRWELQERRIAEQVVLALSHPCDAMFAGGGVQFKFITDHREWLSPPDIAPNRVQNELWNTNLFIDPARTGHHRFHFETARPVDLAEETFIAWAGGKDQPVLAVPGEFFYAFNSDLPLGALAGPDSTTFRLFAPRAQRVEVAVCSRLGQREGQRRLELARNSDGTWEVTVEEDLRGGYYWYFLDGAENQSLQIRPEVPVVDPYALALVGREGPGIILDRSRLAAPAARFQPPAWQDLVVAELHVRDAIARTPLPLGPRERLGFSGLAKWVRSSHFYLKTLGVNAVELQPVQEFDNETDEEYHWGYMPVNYFAPESSYGSDPAKGSQVPEFQDLVQAFHEQGVAVLLDVVYNHVGMPNHLLFLDKQYYLELDTEGNLMNWSGCGNDVRAGAAMSRRLIIDSLVHLVELYDVDGFRFDLAELLGVETLLEIERRLKAVKPSIVLIAEPWSFRGHIGRQLRDTGFSSWNDAFRDFLPQFVHGRGTTEAAAYFLSGSPGELATWPAQTVNYVESHDDRTWIDRITENPDGNGEDPTPNDRRRTHLMVAFLMSAVGIPMIAAGQEFLRSKFGVSNTYQRGDLNALDYGRLERFRQTHDYFRGWIGFRLSDRGRLFRLWERPTHSYLRFLPVEGSSAFAAVFNADRSHGARRLLGAFNPHEQPVTIQLGEAGETRWQQLADEEYFAASGLSGDRYRGGGELILRPLSCGLWEASD